MSEPPFGMSICMPVYRGSAVLRESLETVLGQGFRDFELIIGDDNPPDAADEIAATKGIIESFHDSRIHYHKNPRNLGYPLNLRRIVAMARREVVFLMAQDDLLAEDALRLTMDAFALDPDVGCVTRPYFWFDGAVTNPVRAVLPYDAGRDRVVSIFDGKREFMKIVESVGQLSGLAYRREWLDVPFNDEVFPAHIYPFLGILRRHKCAFLKDYTVAVGIEHSQTRSVSSIYDLSPTASWLKMYDTLFAAPEFRRQRAWGVEHMATNFMGLVQLKNYAKPGVLSREIRIMVRRRPANLLSVRFWFFAIGTILVPRRVLAPLVDWYKARVNARLVPTIRFRVARA